MSLLKVVLKGRREIPMRRCRKSISGPDDPGFARARVSFVEHFLSRRINQENLESIRLHNGVIDVRVTKAITNNHQPCVRP
jgi:hypothetical protein